MTPTGAVILALFATLWWVVGLRAADHGPLLLFAVPLVVMLGLWTLWTRTRRRPLAARPAPDEDARRGRLVGLASAGEGVAILVAVQVLTWTGHRAYIAPAIALIVGAHFIPLAHGLPAPRYYWMAAALGALGVVGILVPDDRVRLTLVCAGAALVLWTTSAVVLRDGRPGDARGGMP